MPERDDDPRPGDGDGAGQETGPRRRRRSDTLDEAGVADGERLPPPAIPDEEPVRRVIAGRILVIGEPKVVVTETPPSVREESDSYESLEDVQILADEESEEIVSTEVIVEEPPPGSAEVPAGVEPGPNGSQTGETRGAAPATVEPPASAEVEEEPAGVDAVVAEASQETGPQAEEETGPQAEEEVEPLGEEAVEAAAVQETKPVAGEVTLGEEAVVEEAAQESRPVDEEETLGEEAVEAVVGKPVDPEIAEAEEVFSSSPPPTRRPSSMPPGKGRRPDSIPPPPPPVPVRNAHGIPADDSSLVVAIPEDDVRRDYKIAVEREALEAAAVELIPPEFMTEEGRTGIPKPRPRRPQRPKKWYEEIFADEYIMGLPRLSDFQYRREIDFVEKGLDLRPGAMILDLGCGVGLHAIGMAKRGYQVVGLDLSVAMLAAAGERAQEEGVKLNFLQGDMRDLQFGPTFDGVYCIGTSFGYFDEENNLKVLQGVHRALKPGGILFVEVENRDYVMRSQPNLLWYEGDGFIAMEETSFDFITSRLSVSRTMLLDGGGKNVLKYSMRVYSLHELGIMLRNNGFSVFQVGGHRAAPAAFLGEESPKLIISARKRTEED